MKRAHRSWHFGIWLLLAPMLALGLYLGLRIRPGPSLYVPTDREASPEVSSRSTTDGPRTIAP